MVLTVAIPLTTKGKTDSVFSRGDAQECIYHRKCPRACRDGTGCYTTDAYF